VCGSFGVFLLLCSSFWLASLVISTFMFCIASQHHSCFPIIASLCVRSLVHWWMYNTGLHPLLEVGEGSGMWHCLVTTIHVAVEGYGTFDCSGCSALTLVVILQFPNLYWSSLWPMQFLWI
jgi:hypothetical protein